MSYIYAMSIVCDLEQFQTTFFDEDFKGSGSSINSVLNQLLEGMHWSHNDLPSCNFVDYIWIESLHTVSSHSVK